MLKSPKESVGVSDQELASVVSLKHAQSANASNNHVTASTTIEATNIKTPSTNALSQPSNLLDFPQLSAMAASGMQADFNAALNS